MEYYSTLKKHPGNPTKSITAKLVRAREDAGFTQKQVEQRSGLLQSELSKLENGHRTIKYELLVELATIYNKPLAYFSSETSVDNYTAEQIIALWREEDPLYGLIPKSEQDKKFLLAFGCHLKGLRKLKKLSQKVLAEKVIVSSKLIREIEQGKTDISITLASTLAHSLGISTKQLFDFEYCNQ